MNVRMETKMDRERFLKEMNNMMRLIRTEFDLTQEKMAYMLGISKKTFVQIEKGRISIDWATAVTLTTVFAQSNVLQNQYGGEVSDMVRAIAFEDDEEEFFTKLMPTMGGRIWWRDIEEDEKYRIQQNVLSNHYRILDPDDRRVISSFNYKVIKKFFDTILGEGEEKEQEKLND